MQHSAGDKRGGNRSTSGKRKHGNETIASYEESSQKARTIPDLFSQEKNNAGITKPRTGVRSPSGKRTRLDDFDQNLPTGSQAKAEPIPVDEMYNFSNTETPKSGGATNTSRPGQTNQTNHSDAQATTASRPRPYNNAQSSSNFTPHSGAKKLVVKNLRVIPRLDQEKYFEKIWSQLDAALTAIFNDEKPSQSLEELYKGSENVCRQGKAADLAKKLQDRCQGHIAGKILESLLAKMAEVEEVDMLRSVEAAWRAWNARLVTIRSIFYYLDQSFLLHSATNPVIYQMGLRQFRKAVFSNEKLKDKILQGACHLVELDRKDDKHVDLTLLRQSVKLFHDLGVYSSEFEPCLLEKSVTFFEIWAREKADTTYLATYVEECHRLIDREMSRCDLFGFDRSTKQRLSEMLDRSLITDQQSVLLRETDILGLLRTNNRIALEQLYTLLERRELGIKLKPAFGKYIIETGSGIVFDEQREGEMVSRLLNFKEELDEIWKKAFGRHQILGNTLRESFETFINQSRKTESNWGTDNPKPGEMIAKYVDMLLKGGFKAIQNRGSAQTLDGDVAMVDEDSEINKQLDQVLDLFRFVHGKAVFEAFYKTDLARRLLLGRSASDEAEKGMLARLRSECGSGFTHNLESMFKDIDLARDEMIAYNNLLREKRERPAVDLSVNVLSAAAWPSYPDIPVNLPTTISQSLAKFEDFYKSKYKGRRLHWKHSLSHCQIKANFPKGTKEIAVSSFQAIVLLLFNDIGNQALSYREIRDATALPDIELRRTLQSLACAKYRVLTKRPKGKDVNDDDTFEFNTGFHDQKIRIKINQIQLKETKQENKATHERVAADRKFETQAAIVRIMKSRKLITHGELVSEVIKATRSRGVLDMAEIKKNIEKLIEKDYMDREEGNKYRYLA